MRTEKPRRARIARSLALVAALAAPPAIGSGAPSREDASGEVRVTWQDVVDIVDEHPTIAAGRHQAEGARAGIDVARAVPNPSLAPSVGYGLARAGEESRVVWGLELSVPLAWAARRRARVDAARAQADVAGADAEALRRDVLLELRGLYWGLAYEQERVVALAELDNQTRDLARTVNKRVGQGEARPVEGIRVEVEAEKLAGELDVARASLDARQRQLGLWLGLDPDQTVVAAADLASLPAPPSRDRALDQARTHHPSVVAAGARIEALQAEVVSERRARVPSFSVGAFADHGLDGRIYGGGLEFDLPVWNWNRGGIRRAESALAAGRAEYEARGLETDAAAIHAQAACQAGVDLAARYRDRIIPRALSAATTIERTYQLGEATLLEVIDARRTLLETRQQLLAALGQAQTDCARLRSVIGEELS